MLKLRAEARLVEVVVTVRDAQGHPVKGLQKSDFTLLDNGKPRAFAIFSANDFDSRSPAITAGSPPDATTIPQPSALPPNSFTNTRITTPSKDTHSTIIILDGMNGWFDSFGWGVKGVKGLLSKAPPDEQLALYAISKFTGFELVQDYTTDRTKLMHAVSTYVPRGMPPAPPGFDAPDGHGLSDPGDHGNLPLKTSGVAVTGLYASRMKDQQMEAQHELQQDSEAVRLSLQALAEKLRTLPGRKSVFWITEGFPPRVLREMGGPAWNKTISALNDANIEVNTVDTDGLAGPSRYWGPGGIISMQMVAEQTGGRAFFHTNDLGSAMAAGIADDRSSYTLAFYLAEVDGKYHDLKVKVERPGVQLNYRQGYFARSEADADLSARKSDLAGVLLNPVDSTGLGITAALETKPGTPRGTVNARLTLDPESLSIDKSPTGWTGKIEEVFIQFNAQNHEVGKVSLTSTFVVDAAHKAGYDAHGPTLSQSVPLAAEAQDSRSPSATPPVAAPAPSQFHWTKSSPQPQGDNDESKSDIRHYNGHTSATSHQQCQLIH